MKLWVLIYVFNVYPSNITPDEIKKNTPHIAGVNSIEVFMLESECAKDKEAYIEKYRKLLGSDVSEFGSFLCLETDMKKR
jgi:hypothetical protein